MAIRAIGLVLMEIAVMCSMASEDAAAWSLAAPPPGREGDAVDPAIQPEPRPYEWPNEPPSDLPHARSDEITGIRFTGRYANYTGADTWYLSWASDGDQYSCWTDGYMWTTSAVEPHECRYCASAWRNLDRKPAWGDGVLQPYHCHSNVGATCTGQARVVGDSPLNLDFIPLGRMHSGQNLYPSVSVVADGVFYIGSYSAFEEGGRFNGFRHSSDWNTWAEELEPEWTSPVWTDGRTPETDFFRDDTELRRFNVPHAVVFGQDNSHSPDGRIYLTAHGSLPGGTSNWDKGDAIYLCRVEAKPESVVDPSAYEFFCGRDEQGRDSWGRDVRDSQPILAWRGHLGSESITYLHALKKYILVSARLKEREENLDHNVLTFWEADQLTGPYRLVHHLRDWGPQTYFPSIPAKFVASDGQSMWLCVSCNYSAEDRTPEQCRYAASFHEITLEIEGRSPEERESMGRNVAPEATIRTSGVIEDTDANSIVKARSEGDAGLGAWAAADPDDAWIELRWSEPRRIHAIRLWDRPEVEHWVRRGTVTFDDGTTETLRAWTSNRALAPSEIRFASRSVRSLRFTIDESDGPHPGLSRLEIFEAPAADE